MRHDRFIRGNAFTGGCLVLALLTGCNTETIPLRLLDAKRPHDDPILGRPPAAVYEAGLLLGGREIELVGHSYGAIRIELVETVDMAVGRSYGGSLGCRETVRATREAAVIAHELAHALGLGHVDASDVDNLMRETMLGTELHDWQLDDLDDGIGRLNACR